MVCFILEYHLQIGPSTHRGGGRKPFRGGGRGHFGYRGSKRSVSATPSRGRGRGQGGGRHIPSNGAASTSNSAAAPAEGPNARMPPSALGLGQASAYVPAQVPAAPLWPPPRMAWCEICRVDCNTVEILEQHKNGKRHKKNLRAHQSLQNGNKLVPGQSDVQMPILTTKPEVVEPEKVERSEEKQPLPENLPLKASVDDNVRDTEQQKDIDEKLEVPMAASAAEPERKPSDHSRARGRGFKRKIRGGRGGKYVRNNEGRRRPAEPPKPKEVIPFICELCNIKCESKVVFDSHLAGKKHLSNLKRFHGHRALYGEAGLQALYPANFSGTQPSSIPQVQQGVNDPQVVLTQLLTYVLSQAQTPGFIASQVQGLAAAPAPAVMSASSFGTQHYPNSQSQGSQATPEVGSKIPAMVDAMNQKQPVSAELGVPPAATANKEAENGNPVSDAKDASLCHNSSVSVPPEKSNLGAQQVISEPVSEKDFCPPECDIGSSGLVAQPGMEDDMQEPGSE
ncbi:hypothetical protein HS088_TW17G00450 [Tripterygium wilfordii]|uniref:U1-type domain-containing protein n=1 Tax=Tripterygium wilfordii TaxID=458696 RepID=A0A7J7CG16_TRIWF|nr:hypothetical protein HS088_TW17G00450 [Tripterygium wilfordii]